MGWNFMFDNLLLYQDSHPTWKTHGSRSYLGNWEFGKKYLPVRKRPGIQKENRQKL